MYRKSLWELSAAAANDRQIRICDRLKSRLTTELVLEANYTLSRSHDKYFGRSVLLRTSSQLPTVFALLALDGIAGRMLLCPSDITQNQLPQIIEDGEVTDIVTDDELNALITPSTNPEKAATVQPESRPIDTEWILFTSGTSGTPKLVQHSIQSLCAPIAQSPADTSTVWSTFYDIRRYGGLQILLRALLTGSSMVLSDSDETAAAFLVRLSENNVSHLSGTPSHWRRAIMSGASEQIAPSYVRLSGEIADQAILDRLAKIYRDAKIAHAFASTEAGVVFSVDDGFAGVPVSFFEPGQFPASLSLDSGTLRVHSNATAVRYLGKTARQLKDAAGFVDTGDRVERRDDRYYFLGRREGVVNVGGQKIYPEEVEAVINHHPAVLLSRVWGRKSPITGTLVAADVVLLEPNQAINFDEIRDEILDKCYAALEPYKVPTKLRVVDNIGIMTSGKVDRQHA